MKDRIKQALWISAMAIYGIIGCSPIAPSVDKRSFNPQTHTAEGGVSPASELLGTPDVETHTIVSIDDDRLNQPASGMRVILLGEELEEFVDLGLTGFDTEDVAVSGEPSKVWVVVNLSEEEVAEENQKKQMKTWLWADEDREDYYVLGRNRDWKESTLESIDFLRVEFENDSAGD